MKHFSTLSRVFSFLVKIKNGFYHLNRKMNYKIYFSIFEKNDVLTSGKKSKNTMFIKVIFQTSFAFRDAISTRLGVEMR